MGTTSSRPALSPAAKLPVDDAESGMEAVMVPKCPRGSLLPPWYTHVGLAGEWENIFHFVKPLSFRVYLLEQLV